MKNKWKVNKKSKVNKVNNQRLFILISVVVICNSFDELKFTSWVVVRFVSWSSFGIFPISEIGVTKDIWAFSLQQNVA